MSIAYTKGGAPDGAAAGTAETLRIILRGQHQDESAGTVLEGSDARDLLAKALATDVAYIDFPIIDAKGAPVTFLDADTHHLAVRPDGDELAAHAAAIEPRPDAWWRTHGAGLRLAYCGEDHEEAGVKACLSVPQLFTVEVKRDSRHPLGAHPNYPGAVAGSVHWINSPRPSGVHWGSSMVPDDVSVAAVLEERALEIGGRYGHDRCPLAGSQSSQPADCVVVGSMGIFCHRCAAHQIAIAPGLPPGFMPFEQLGAWVVPATLVKLARNFVHWRQAWVELADVHPNLNEAILRRANNFALTAIHGATDPRISMVFNPDLDLLMTDVGAIDARTLKLIQVTDDTLNALPSLYFRRDTGGKGEPKLLLRCALRDRVRNNLLPPGYRAVRVARGIAFRDDPKFVTVCRSPVHGAPVRLLSTAELIPQTDAFALLQASFPGLSPAYLTACLAGAICAEHGARPPMLLSAGPSGSAKYATIRLSASFTADDVVSLTVTHDEEQFWRSIGTPLAEGHRFFLVDELLRLDPASQKKLILYFLKIASSVTWRPLYGRSVQSPTRALFVFAAGSVPASFRQSPEIRRRAWLARLPASVPTDWSESCGGDLADWRGRSPENALIANSILTHSFLLCAAHEFHFDRVAAALGLEQLDEGESGFQEVALRRLYAFCRNQIQGRALQIAPRYAAGRWVDAYAGSAPVILNDLAGDDGSADQKSTLSDLTHNLSMTAWNRVLGIGEPGIVFEMRKHGQLLAMRFRSARKCATGQYLINEDLPPGVFPVPI